MSASETLVHLLEGLHARRVRPWNVATITGLSGLSDLFAGRGAPINEISGYPLEQAQLSDLERLRIYPSGWADLIVVEAACCPDLQPEQLWTEMARIAAMQGLMVVVQPEGSAASTPWFRDRSIQAAIAGYVQTFGTEPWPEAAQQLLWAKRNARLFSSAAASAQGLDRVTRQLGALTGYIDELSQVIPQLSGSPLTEPVSLRGAVADDVSRQSQSSPPLCTDLEATIADLHSQLQARQQDCRSAQAELARLQQRYLSLRQVLAGGAPPAGMAEQGDLVADQAAEIRSLRQQLEEMTASYLEMRDTVHALIASGFWRITWLPRRLLDRLRVSLQISRGLLPPRGPRALRRLKTTQVAAAAPRLDFADGPAAEVSVAASVPVEAQPQTLLLPVSDGAEQHPALWQSLWTGTFLTLRDNSTAASQHRLDRILFVDWRLPEPDQDSGSCRIHAILEIAVSLGLRVDFIADSENQDEKYRDSLLHLGVHVIEGRQQGLRHLQRFGLHYRQCFVCRPEPASFYFPLIRCFCPEAQLIYDTVDLHYSRFYRASRLSGLSDVERAMQLSLHHHYKSAETFLARSADCIAVVTELERQEVLATIAPDSPVVVLPNIHALPQRTSLPPWERRQDILFVGGFDHAPNVDAVHYFCQQILPLVVSQLPTLTFHVVGSNMPAEIRSLKGPHVNPIGYVEDLRQIFDRVRVFVAPLRYGAGLKGKVGQSMSYGVPVVGTSVAFEGFGIVDEQQGMIANQSQDFARALIRAYSDRDLWQLLSTQAWNLIDERFSTQAVRKSLQSLLQTAAQ
jgi:glycosyltransferase involved in cell wall biosynthesis